MLTDIAISPAGFTGAHGRAADDPQMRSGHVASTKSRGLRADIWDWYACARLFVSSLTTHDPLTSGSHRHYGWLLMTRHGGVTLGLCLVLTITSMFVAVACADIYGQRVASQNVSLARHCRHAWLEASIANTKNNIESPCGMRVADHYCVLRDNGQTDDMLHFVKPHITSFIPPVRNTIERCNECPLVTITRQRNEYIVLHYEEDTPQRNPITKEFSGYVSMCMQHLLEARTQASEWCAGSEVTAEMQKK